MRKLNFLKVIPNGYKSTQGPLQIYVCFERKAKMGCRSAWSIQNLLTRVLKFKEPFPFRARRRKPFASLRFLFKNLVRTLAQATPNLGNVERCNQEEGAVFGKEYSQFPEESLCFRAYAPLVTDGEFQLSHEENPGWLGYIGDYTTQLYGDYNKPL